MKVIFPTAVSKGYKYFDKIFNRSNAQKLIYKTLIDIHSKCCDRITQFVLKGKRDTFECEHYIDLYKRLCVYSHTVKTDSFDTLGFIKFKKEFYSYYKED